MLRILRYGLIYWVVGIIITFSEVQFRVSPAVVRGLFYVINIVLPLCFFSVYLRRSAMVSSWKDGLKVGAIWMGLILVLDAILYMGFMRIGWSVYFSINTLVEIIFMLGIGSLLAWHTVRLRGAGGPEGLA